MTHDEPTPRGSRGMGTAKRAVSEGSVALLSSWNEARRRQRSKAAVDRPHRATKRINPPCGIGLVKTKGMTDRKQQEKDSCDSIKERRLHLVPPLRRVGASLATSLRVRPAPGLSGARARSASCVQLVYRPSSVGKPSRSITMRNFVAYSRFSSAFACAAPRLKVVTARNVPSSNDAMTDSGL